MMTAHSHSNFEKALKKNKGKNGKGEPGDFDAAAGDMMDFLRRLGWLQ